MDGRFLGEKEVRPVKGQIAVDLVGGNLMVAADAVLPARVHQHLRTQNVGLQEHLGIFNGAIHMTFGGEVHHHVGMLLLKKPIHPLPVADVQLHKAEVGGIHDRSQRGQIAGIGQLVQADDPVVRVFAEHMENEIGADKSGAAGHDDGHFSPPLSFFFMKLLKRSSATCRRWRP